MEGNRSGRWGRDAAGLTKGRSRWVFAGGGGSGEHCVEVVKHEVTIS